MMRRQSCGLSNFVNQIIQICFFLLDNLLFIVNCATKAECNDNIMDLIVSMGLHVDLGSIVQ